MENKDPNQLTFIEHLEALRWHILRSLTAVLLVSILAFLNKSFVFDRVILAPKNEEFITYRFLCWLSHQMHMGANLCMDGIAFTLQNVDMPGQFLMHVKVSFIAGLIVAFPYIFWEIWRFVKPGLHDNEIRHTRGLVFACSTLFFVGVLFGYYIIVPFSINFLGNYQVSEEVINEINLGSYISVVSMITLAAGIIFELPVASYLLSRMGLLTPGFLKSHRREAFVIILVLAAIITPPDVTSQIMIAIPILFLYEVSIVISRRVNRRREEELK